MDGVKWNVRVFAEGWMEWNEMDMDPYVGPYVDLRVMDWNPALGWVPFSSTSLSSQIRQAAPVVSYARPNSQRGFMAVAAF